MTLHLWSPGMLSFSLPQGEISLLTSSRASCCHGFSVAMASKLRMHTSVFPFSSCLVNTGKKLLHHYDSMHISFMCWAHNPPPPSLIVTTVDSPPLVQHLFCSCSLPHKHPQHEHCILYLTLSFSPVCLIISSTPWSHPPPHTSCLTPHHFFLCACISPLTSSSPSLTISSHQCCVLVTAWY